MKGDCSVCLVVFVLSYPFYIHMVLCKGLEPSLISLSFVWKMDNRCLYSSNKLQGEN